MREQLSAHVRHNIVAYLALFVALGGSAYAAASLPKDSVGTKQLKNRAVTNPKLAKGAVRGANVAKQSLTGRQIKASTLGTVPKATLATTALHAAGEFHATVEGGVVVQGSPGVAVEPDLVAGHVPLNFPRDITRCSWLAAPLNPNQGGPGNSIGFAIAEAPSPTQPRQLSVRTFDKTGAPASRDFSVAVFC